MKTLLAFEKALQAAKSTQEISAAVTACLESLGISTFSFTYYSYYPNALNKIKLSLSSENYRAWHQHYLQENYEEIDTTLDHVYRMTLPLFWDIKQQLKQARSEKELLMRQDSLRFGAEKGLSIPIHGPDDDFAIFLIVQMQGESALDHWQELQFTLLAVGYYLYSYLQSLLLKTQQSTTKHQLNKRELQCLQLVAKQYSVSAIAKALNITERTVNFHIQRLNKKLGTKNKYQSVLRAQELGILGAAS